MIVTLSDSKGNLPIDQFITDRVEITQYHFNDRSWSTKTSNINLLIIVYDQNSSLPEEVETFKQSANKGAILPVCLGDKKCSKPEALNDLDPVFLPDEEKQLNQRVLSRLSNRHLNPDRPIFISYQQDADQAWVKTLIKVLKKYDYTVTWDQEWGILSKHQINDDEIKKIINKHLLNACFLIVIYSKKTRLKGWVDYEVKTALDFSVPIQKLSFHIDNCFFDKHDLRCYEFDTLQKEEEHITQATWEVAKALSLSLFWET